MINKIKIKIYRFLRWAEKWTQTDMVYLAKGNFWLSLGQGISIVSAFLLSIAFANLIPQETLGQYKYILSIIGLLTIPTLVGMGTAIVQATARGYEGTLIQAIKTKIKWGSLGGIASLIISLYYYINGNTTLTFCFIIIAIFLPFSSSLKSYGAFLSGKKLFNVSTKISVISNFFITLLMVSILFVSNNIILIFFIYFFSRAFIHFILLNYSLNKHKTNDRIDTDAINYGKHLSLMNIFSSIVEQLDKILIWHYLGAPQLAIYAMATVPVNQIQSGLLKNITPLALPKFSANTAENLKKTLPKKIKKYLLITIPVALIYIISAPLIFKTIYPQYADSVIYSQILAITIALIPLSFLNTALTAQKQKKKLYFASTTSSILKITSLAVLLPLYGIAGVIGAIIGNQIYNIIVLIYLFKKM